MLPDATILIDYMLNRMNRVLSDLRVYPENMKRNIDRTFGLTFSQRVLTALIDKGVAREDAYDKTVQPAAMQAWEEGRPFYDIVREKPLVREKLTDEELLACFDPSWHIKHVDTIMDRFGL